MKIINPYYETAKAIESALGGNINKTLDGIEYKSPEYNQAILCRHCNKVDAWRKVSVGSFVCNSCGSVKIPSNDSIEKWSICKVGYYDKNMCNHSN